MKRIGPTGFWFGAVVLVFWVALLWSDAVMGSSFRWVVRGLLTMACAELLCRRADRQIGSQDERTP